jgi:hypothetical protein
MKRVRVLVVLAISIALLSVCGPVWAQKSYDDHEMKDRFYITVGGFNRTDLRTTLRLDAKSPQAGLGLGAVIGLESLFKVENSVTTVRLDGWYRFGKKHRIAWTFWQSERDGVSTYEEDEPLQIGDEILINTGDTVAINDRSSLTAVNWTYSFLNVAKYEAWLGIGLNFSSVDTTIDVNLGNVIEEAQEEAKGLIPVPTINLGGRWNFNERVRMLFFLQLFGLKFGDYEGRLNNTRLLAEWDITRNFGIGGGFERFAFEVDAEGEDFTGSLDTSYTAFSLFLKGQI